MQRRRKKNFVSCSFSFDVTIYKVASRFACQTESCIISSCDTPSILLFAFRFHSAELWLQKKSDGCTDGVLLPFFSSLRASSVLGGSFRIMYFCLESGPINPTRIFPWTEELRQFPIILRCCGLFQSSVHVEGKFTEAQYHWKRRKAHGEYIENEMRLNRSYIQKSIAFTPLHHNWHQCPLRSMHHLSPSIWLLRQIDRIHQKIHQQQMSSPTKYSPIHYRTWLYFFGTASFTETLREPNRVFFL